MSSGLPWFLIPDDSVEDSDEFSHDSGESEFFSFSCGGQALVEGGQNWVMAAGLNVGERRVGRLMKINGIRPVRTRKHKVTTDSNHRLGVAANWLAGDFTADAPNRKWAGDITYVWTSEGWLYLAVILDLHSRRVVGWAVSDRMKRDLAIRALDMAVRLRRPPEGCIFHADRGSQYCSYDYQKSLQTHGLRPSMSGKGNCVACPRAGEARPGGQFGCRDILQIIEGRADLAPELAN